MTSRNIFILIATSIVLALLVTMTFRYELLATAKQQDSSPTTEAKQLFQVVKRNGWIVPSLGQNTVASLVKTINVDGMEVSKKRLQLSGEPSADIEFYYARNDGQLIINSVLFAVQEHFLFESRGQAFAHELHLVPINISEDGTRTYFGAMVIFYYFDEDGDSKFETRYGNKQSLHVPVWIKAKR